jgi:hypothetical protein
MHLYQSLMALDLICWYIKECNRLDERQVTTPYSSSGRCLSKRLQIRANSTIARSFRDTRRVPNSRQCILRQPRIALARRRLRVLWCRWRSCGHICVYYALSKPSEPQSRNAKTENGRRQSVISLLRFPQHNDGLGLWGLLLIGMSSCVYNWVRWLNEI